MLEGITATLESLIMNLGPPAIFLAMFIETIFPPIPSELVMPLGGYVAYASGQGYIGLFTMILAGSLGSTLGAIIIYLIALYGGRQLVLKYGNRLGVDKKKLDIADVWFKKYGTLAVFFGRMAPGVRELISIPAGIARMEFVKFSIFTFAGSFVWSAFLGSVGYFLAEAWRDIGLGSIIGIVGIVIVLAIVFYFVFNHLVRKKK
jgi:membrane protein DedA with SNARE-associated domain